jgi:hypothetical protein
MATKTPRIGDSALTADGHLLGKVSEVVGPCFKVEIPMGIDQWLGEDTIAGGDENDVRLSLTRDDIQGEPEGIAHAGFHVHRET